MALIWCIQFCRKGFAHRALGIQSEGKLSAFEARLDGAHDIPGRAAHIAGALLVILGA